MDDYEVDLIDYLRVIWWGKWIIIACLVVAVAVSAAIMWTRPNEYAMTVLYQYHEQLSQLTSPRQANPSSQATTVSSKQNAALSFALDTTPLPASKDKLSKKTAESNNSGSVTLSGSVPPTKLSQVTATFTSLVNKNLMQQMKDSVELAIDSANMRVAQLSKERGMLKERMTAALATNDPVTDYLAAKVADLEGTIVQDQALAETLLATDPATLFQLTSSQGGASLVGPNRKISVAVAGVLGLFVGILLAFFVHYLIDARDKKTKHKEA